MNSPDAADPGDPRLVTYWRRRGYTQADLGRVIAAAATWRPLTRTEAEGWADSQLPVESIVEFAEGMLWNNYLVRDAIWENQGWTNYDEMQDWVLLFNCDWCLPGEICEPWAEVERAVLALQSMREGLDPGEAEFWVMRATDITLAQVRAWRDAGYSADDYNLIDHAVNNANASPEQWRCVPAKLLLEWAALGVDAGRVVAALVTRISAAEAATFSDDDWAGVWALLALKSPTAARILIEEGSNLAARG